MALVGLAAIALLAVVIVTIKTKDGKETEVAINVPGDVSSVSTSVREDAGGKAVTKPGDLRSGEVARSDTGHNDADANAAKFTTLAALDPTQIPESERFDWQPEELVAVVGTHRLRAWVSINRVTFHPSGDFFISSSNGGTRIRLVNSDPATHHGGRRPGMPGKRRRFQSRLCSGWQVVLLGSREVRC